MKKELYLYDTFSGMTKPSIVDISFSGDMALERFSKNRISDNESMWCYSTIDEVRANVFQTGYPKENFHFVKGKVEETIPAIIPKTISLLRLDTDWYESTKHELFHLFPRLSPKGIVIFDDYSCWEGHRKAVDEYIMENQLSIFLTRIDYSGRIGLKIP